MHIPYRIWCPACFTGLARDRPHRREEGQEDKQTPDIVFDYVLLGAEGNRDATASLEFAHITPGSRATHELGA